MTQCVTISGGRGRDGHPEESLLFTVDQGSPAPELALDLFEAIGRKAWSRVEELAAPDVVVEVRAAAGIRTQRNEHLWRSVSLRGTAALRDYLGELHQAIPALTVQPRSAARAVDTEQEVIRADCAGVDNAGSPFDAETDFTLWSRDGTLHRIEAHVNEVVVGAEVIRHTEGDPRRYFTHFLNDHDAVE